MFHYVYITTNLANGKKYIGKHSFKSLQNNYLGSGHGIKAAVQKYGRDGFIKEIISVHDTEDLAYEAEKKLVESYDAVKNPLFYNRTNGGRGGEAERNLNEEHRIKISESLKGRKISDQHKKRLSDIKKANPTGAAVKGKKKSREFAEKIKQRHKNNPLTHSEETKKNISEKLKGSGNAGFGLKWITDGVSNDRIKPDDSLPEGWRWGKRPYGKKKRKL